MNATEYLVNFIVERKIKAEGRLDAYRTTLMYTSKNCSGVVSINSMLKTRIKQEEEHYTELGMLERHARWGMGEFKQYVKDTQSPDSATWWLEIVKMLEGYEEGDDRS